MKKSFVIISVLVAVLVVFIMLAPKNTDKSNNKIAGLPWQIEVLPDGNATVFGITLGRSSFADVKRLAGGGDIAIMSTGAADVSLEMYVNRFQAGVLTGKLVLVAGLPQDQLSVIRKRAIRSGGENKFKMHPDDRVRVVSSIIESMAFIPLVNLDEDVVRQRFGKPAETIKQKTLTHMLYPEKGLDVIVDSEGKEVLQYISPKFFKKLSDPLH